MEAALQAAPAPTAVQFGITMHPGGGLPQPGDTISGPQPQSRSHSIPEVPRSLPQGVPASLAGLQTSQHALAGLPAGMTISGMSGPSSAQAAKREGVQTIKSAMGGE